MVDAGGGIARRKREVGLGVVVDCDGPLDWRACATVSKTFVIFLEKSLLNSIVLIDPEITKATKLMILIQ